jgi:hypothetical protein
LIDFATMQAVSPHFLRVKHLTLLTLWKKTTATPELLGRPQDKKRRKGGKRQHVGGRVRTASTSVPCESEGPATDDWGWGGPPSLEEERGLQSKVETRTEEELHRMESWRFCYDDYCMTHWEAKNTSGKWPQRRR